MDTMPAVKVLDKNAANSFYDIFKSYYAALSFFAFKFINDSAKAEEIASDSFVKLWRHWDSERQEAAIRSFLYTTTKNACLNYLRDNKSRQVKERALIDSLPKSSKAIDETIIQAETLRAIYEQLKTLPAQCKTVIEQIYIDGKTPKQIATESGLSIDTIRVQKMMGLRKLRQAMREKQ